MATPTIGRTVHYRLSADDAECINRRRGDGATSGASHGHTGFIVHAGNHAAEGQILPAVIVRIWGKPEDGVNLQVSLDGNDTYWATSRKEGPDVGQWTWPELT
ncbi:hypothetical protein DMB38_20005 [Streptomyces sp. WAC 06738]|uniref:hypothetical protein n=1 Tax=Streptomyces sp. WAC 06738 TaxID=2203210 RepID=UPI000F6DDD4B|nr:hypothetical protein [Streptomyces sp. WAC 06738]AZM47762.1 hypothetical protein DMB38_20005 [Streptomyces sp. WAC 06738]